MWDSQTIVYPAQFRKMMAIRLKDQWITSYNTNLMSKSICRSYKTYKHIYCWEDYIVKLSKANRIVLTNLRTTDKLPITA